MAVLRVEILGLRVSKCQLEVCSDSYLDFLRLQVLGIPATSFWFNLNLRSCSAGMSSSSDVMLSCLVLAIGCCVCGGIARGSVGSDSLRNKPTFGFACDVAASFGRATYGHKGDGADLGLQTRRGRRGPPA